MVVHCLNIVQKVEIFVNMKPLRHKNHVLRSPINNLCSNPVSLSAKSECWQQRFRPCQQKQALMGVIDCHHYNSETAMGGYTCPTTGSLDTCNQVKGLLPRGRTRLSSVTVDCQVSMV